MKHPGVIELKLFLSDINVVIMEYANQGSVFHYLYNRDTLIGWNRQSLLIPTDWDLRLKWTIQLANAICFIHSHNVVHRDLRCVNLLVNYFVTLFLTHNR